MVLDRGELDEESRFLTNLADDGPTGNILTLRTVVQRSANLQYVLYKDIELI
jgi:hypothetical protein